MKVSEHIAAECLSFDETLAGLASQRAHVDVLFSRLRRISSLPERALVLDIGAGTGGFVAACLERDHTCKGVEPWDQARSTAVAIGRQLDLPMDIVPGSAEDIPYPSDTFDLVHANSVMEHVADLDHALAEIFRVLKPGGVFWFYTASAMCPLQGEIQGFPLFGWYPDRLKRRIMDWAKDSRPHLVGRTQAPAVNWFTPWKTRALLRRHGFRRVYDRWDLRGQEESGKAYRLALDAVRSTKVSKALADVFVPDCSYAAVK